MLNDIPKMSNIKNLFSFLFDIPVEARTSALNKILEVNLYRGRFLLDAENANYSFGKLHQVFEETFARLNLRKRKIDNALILGYGGGSVAHILTETFPEIRITGIDHDPVVLDLAAKYFYLNERTNVKVQCCDAYDFVVSCNEKFDLVVIDLYNDNIVPEKFRSVAFFKELEKLNDAGGLLVFNRLIYGCGENPDEAMKQFRQVFPNAYGLSVLDNMVIYLLPL